MSLALSVLGWLSAHGLAYRFVAPDPHERHHLLAASGHSYLPYVPFALTFCVAIVAVCLAALVATGIRARSSPRISLASLGVVPLLAFTAQEHLEHFLHQGGHLHMVAAEPTFVVGMLLQLPFALAAVFVGRALLTFAAALARRLRDRQRERVVAPRSFEPALVGDLPRVAALALAHAPRAPPHLLSP